MAADNKLELVVEIDPKGANASVKMINRGLSSIEESAAKAARGAARGFDDMAVSVAKGAVAAEAVSGAFRQAKDIVQQYTVEAAKLAARNETLGVVTAQLARTNGYNVDAVERLVGRIKDLGITTQVSRDAVAKMIAAQLDLSKATDLARMAQDAAVISGQNSSEALQGIMQGITTQQIEVLRTYGINVQFEKAFMQARQRMGRDLTDAERKNIAFQTVLAQAPRIAGSYEASLGTVGKQAASLARFTEEAKSAIGDRFLPEMRKMVGLLTEGAKWAKDNADMIALLAKALGGAAIAAAVAQFVVYMRGAKTAVDALTVAITRNPFAAAAAAITAAGFAVYELKSRNDELAGAMAKTNEEAADTQRIMGLIAQGKTSAELERMGISAENVRKAMSGARGALEEFAKADAKHFKGRIEFISSEEETRARADAARQSAAELAKDIAKHQADVTRDAVQSARTAQMAWATGPLRAIVDLYEQARKAALFVDSKGVEHQIRLTGQARAAMEQELAAKVREMNRTESEKYLAGQWEIYQAKLAQETELYQRRIANEEEISRRDLDHVRELYRIQEDRSGYARDAELRAVDATNAQTLEQKIAVEQKKADIEIRHIEQVHELRMKVFDLDTQTMMLAEEANLKRLGYMGDEMMRRLGDLAAQRSAIKGASQEAQDAAVQAARETANNRAVDLIQNQNRQIFESFKRQAEGVFDALLTRSQSVWSAIGNSLKTAMLTAIKEVVTSRVALALMRLLGGMQGTGAGGGSGSSGGVLGGLGGILGAGSMAGGGLIPGGSAGGLGTPPFWGGSGGGAGVAGWGGMASGAKGWLTSLGNIGIKGKDGLPADMTGQAGRGVGGWQGGAMLVGGSILAYDGLRRGGLVGLGETTAGGALIGAKFGGPVGALIGGAIGFGAGLIRLFIKGAQEKAREKIKAAYGVDISDQGVLRQIVDLAKSAFGGNLDMAIRAQQVTEIVSLYAMSRGLPTRGLPATMRPIGMAQTGGSLYQIASGAGATQIDRIGAGTATNAGPTVVIPLQIDSETVGTAVIRNGRVVVQGALGAMRGNAGRREMAALQLSPGLVMS